MVDVLIHLAESEKALKLAAEMSMTYYGRKLVVAYSGGKDSDVLIHLAESVLKPEQWEVINSHTSVDAPPTVKHIRETKKRLAEKGVEMTILIPKGKDGKQLNMAKLVWENRNPPRKNARFCCKSLKETSVQNALRALGVRSAESTNRQGREIFSTGATGGKGIKTGNVRFFSIEQAETAHFDYLNNKDSACEHALIKEMLNHSDTIVNPIYFWTDSEIWEYIRRENIKINPLYYPPYNYKRVGCLLCPMASYAEKKKQEADFPGYKKLYIHIFDKMLKIRKERGLENRSAWATGEDVYNWWIEEYKHNVKGQISIEEWLRSKDG